MGTTRAEREALYGGGDTGAGLDFGSISSDQMVQRIFQNYTPEGKYDQRVGADESEMVNDDVDYITSQFLGPLAEANGLDIAPQQIRYFADQMLRGNMSEAEAAAGMEAEYKRTGFSGADGTKRPYDGVLRDSNGNRINEDGSRINEDGTPFETGTGEVPDIEVDWEIPTPVEPPDIFDQDTFEQIKSVLREYGLESLATGEGVDADGNPVESAQSMIQRKASKAEVINWMYGTDAFKDRFPAIAMIDLDNKGGVVRANITPQRYMDLEDDYFTYLSQVGLADAFFTRDRVGEWIYGGNSPLEISRRVVQGVTAMQLSSIETREFFQDTYGVEQGELALAAYFLDKGNVEAELIRQVEVSKIGGRSTIANIGIGAAGAKRLAELGITAQEAGTQFANINRRAGLFRETVSESRDLTKEDEGVDSAFGLDDGDANNRLQGRLRARQAAFRGGGGAFMGNRATGFGSA